MKTTALISFRVLIILTVITGILYPLLMTVFAFVAFPDRSQGSIVRRDGIAVGSSLIGQRFTSPEYFHGRPSAAGNDPMSSGATNFGPTNRALRDSAAVRRELFIRENSLSPAERVPSEMLFASGSGLDPEIGPEAALLQVGRIARARHFDEPGRLQLVALIGRMAKKPDFGVLGRPRVNVLLLNLALDDMDRR